MKTAVALIFFRRPRETLRVFRRIRAARPERLYLICDGAREGRDDEAGRVVQARRVVDRVDWPCDVVRIYSDENLGCKRRVSSGLDAVFASEERAIILEDDCVPHPDFFPFCERLLERYADDKRIGQIGGSSFLWGRVRMEESYWFGIYPICWGWATWRDRWRLWDGELERWPEVRDDPAWWEGRFDSRERQFWTEVLDGMRDGTRRCDTWDYQWGFTHFWNRWLAVHPRVNLVRNIGWSDAATHTAESNRSMRPPYAHMGRMNHRAIVERHLAADRLLFDTAFWWGERRPWKIALNRLRIWMGANLRDLLRRSRAWIGRGGQRDR